MEILTKVFLLDFFMFWWEVEHGKKSRICTQWRKRCSGRVKRDLFHCFLHLWMVIIGLNWASCLAALKVSSLAIPAGLFRHCQEGSGSLLGVSIEGGRLTGPSSALSFPAAPTCARCRSWSAPTGNISPTASSGTRGRSAGSPRKSLGARQGLPKDPVEVGAGWEKQTAAVRCQSPWCGCHVCMCWELL